MKHTDKELDDRIEAFMKRKASKLHNLDSKTNKRTMQSSRTSERDVATWRSLFSRRMVGA